MPIQTLLLTGENNHDWRRSSPFLKKLLEDSGKFKVDLTENPSQTLSDAATLQKYQLIFTDYNGKRWDEPARINFVNAIRGGTGLVILHAADNCFSGWPEYEQLCGIMFRNGAGHGDFHEFTVTITDPSHPITQGLNDFKQWDELYHNMDEIPSANFQVIADAYSAPETKGSGKREPMALVSQFGSGRVFHDLLGHVWPGDPNGSYKGASMIAFENPAFQKLLLRGAEWAATGTVV